MQIPSVATLLPQPSESVAWDTTEHQIIEGDNLEVLKLLQKSYHGKIKMIYIDPPYNTGNEFIYPDNYREGLKDYLRYSGQVSEEGIKWQYAGVRVFFLSQAANYFRTRNKHSTGGHRNDQSH